MSARLLRYAAFTIDGTGGNPAGVVLDATGLDESAMQQIAADVGYSETAFLFPRSAERNVYDVRYYSPLAEVPFCGHATIAAAVALVERSPADELVFHTKAGFVSVATRTEQGKLVAELTSVAPRVAEPPAALVPAVLRALGWSDADLDPHYPTLLANAGSQHLILVVRKRQRLADLHYDFDALAAIMAEEGLVTIALIWPEPKKKRYHARNPFPPGGVVEDPATGAAAAAFGGYLRALGKIGENARFTILQGADLGRPSELQVSVIGGEPGVRVAGAATPISELDRALTS